MIPTTEGFLRRLVDYFHGGFSMLIPGVDYGSFGDMNHSRLAYNPSPPQNDDLEILGLIKRSFRMTIGWEATLQDDISTTQWQQLVIRGSEGVLANP